MSANGFQICWLPCCGEKENNAFYCLLILNILSPEPTAGSLLQFSESRTQKTAYDTANSNTLLKGQCHEIFDFRFFPQIISPHLLPAPDDSLGPISIFFKNSRKFLQLKVFHQCRLTPAVKRPPALLTFDFSFSSMHHLSFGS